ncbi:MAG: hypothetical protein M3256_02355 [Actinomycetota bacterium]|nr:hypothetical protein [Actinomycetota bacterium]
MSSEGSTASEDRRRSFALVAHAVLELYGQRRFGEALQVADQAVSPFLDFSARTTWFRACLLCRLGKPDEALRALESGVEKGEWWSEGMLRTDADLEPLWGRAEFERLIARSTALGARANEISLPELNVIEPETGRAPLPLLIALHGAGGLPGVGEHWELASGHGWLVALARSSRLIMTGAPVWNDLPRARTELRAHHEALAARYQIDPIRTVLAGFSQGARVAVELGLEGEVGSTGLIAVAPWFHDLDQVMRHAGARRPHPRVYLFMGQKDPGLENVRSAYAALQRANLPCTMDEGADVGHAFPSDTEGMLRSALTFVTAQS